MLFPDRGASKDESNEEEHMGGRKPRITMSGLLNALDGTMAQSGRMVFMSTNYPQRLDAALLRPGRIDVKFELGWASRFQMQKMFMKFFPEV